MKIAIFHDYFDEIGGAEISLLVLARALGATIITTNIDKDKISDLGYNDVAFITIGRLPAVKYLKQHIAKWRFFRCNFSTKFDFFIFGGFRSIAAAKRHQNNLWYCFSPERGLYDLRYQHFSKYNLPMQAIISILIIIDKYFEKQVKKIVSISRNAQLRVEKYYKRSSSIIYPPVEISKFNYQKNGDFWLSVNRLFPHKRVDLQLKAFAKLPGEKLIIVGCYEKSDQFSEYQNYLQKIQPKNVEILNWIDQKKLINLYADCKGFITTSHDEDFGLTAVEAMASGKSVIAPNEGGYKETVIDGATGKLIDDINTGKLIQAIKDISSNPEKYKDACLAQAQKFEANVFIKKIKELITTDG